MDTLDIQMDTKQVKHDLLKGIAQCNQRGLNQTVKWLSELNYSLSHINLTQEELPKLDNIYHDDYEAYLLAKSYFNLKEYDRSAYFVKNCSNPIARFLYFYSRYFSAEKRKLDNMTDTTCPPDASQNDKLKELCNELKCDYYENKLDGYCMYLYGIVLKKLELKQLATDVLVKAVQEQPILWCAWYELGKLVPDKTRLLATPLPDHWIKQFFIAHTYLEQLNNDEALHIYTGLENIFVDNTYVLSQIAIARHNKRNLDDSVEAFQKVQELDPYRLDNLDTYSNVLYVMERKTELAELAHRVVDIDKYRVETCCVIGNYYSLRSDHAKAIMYFRRALKLNPQFLSAWTLIGHEYMEMKNINAAIQSYRHAIEINSRDYRAWYGLGQTYEILKMPLYCLYYYKQAQQLKPNDSRMVTALGETYEKLDKNDNALKCYYKACTVGDIEGGALIKLAKLYDKLNETDNAAAAFTEFCLRDKDEKVEDQTEFYNALQYLANYHLKKGELEDAYTYAYKCMECEETKEQGKALLKAIAARRIESDPVDEVSMNEAVGATEVGEMSIANDEEPGGNTSNMDMALSP